MKLKIAFSPTDLPTQALHDYIEASRNVAILHWLIDWANEIESIWNDYFLGYPFCFHEGPVPVHTQILYARDALTGLLAEEDIGSALARGNSQVLTFANTLAIWRGEAIRSVWDVSSLMDLIDVSSYLP